MAWNWYFESSPVNQSHKFAHCFQGSFLKILTFLALPFFFFFLIFIHLASPGFSCSRQDL